MVSTINQSSYSQIFFWDWRSDQNFFKMFISGIFLAICMTGLDQDLMQKNISCKNIKEAQKNMFVFSGIMVVVNLFFLALGALLFIYANKNGIAIPARTDELYPRLALQQLGIVTGIFFLLGIIASSYASADSALTALTTSFCIDFLDFKTKKEKEKQRLKWYVHIGFSVIFLLIIVVFKEVSDNSLIKTVLKMASYTYGPLLGLFSFGIFSKRQIKDKLSPLVCVIAPIITIWLVNNSEQFLWGYKFSFEILLLNGLLTYLGLFLISKPSTK
jgi:Na+/proline symporter